MIKSFFLYTSYTLVTLAIVVVSFVNLAPQFGSNPTSEQIKYYGTFPNYRDGGFESLEKTPMMTGEVSTWEFLRMIQIGNLRVKLYPRILITLNSVK